MTKSANNKVWQQAEVNETLVMELLQKLKISDLLARILSIRIENIEQAEDFLLPKIRNLLPDPFHLLDMDKAVSRAILAIEGKQKICIFADYDVDGATSSALLKNVFRDLGVIVDIYVPDRIAEGYGPSAYAMQKIRQNGTQLLITVDCGAMAHDALKYASEVGLEVIVIDHHMSLDSLPEAVAIINPNRLDEQSEYKYLAAVGVSFLFAVALISELKKINYFDKLVLPDLIKYLDLVALGTVCDIMSITKLNRAFVTQGLKIMAQRQNIGIKTLCDSALLEEGLNCYHLGFVLGPRINAGGRVGKSSLGAHLLSSISEEEAVNLANELEKHNNERKIVEALILEEAVSLAQSQQDDHFLFIACEGWHPGVIGIVASKLKEQFNKPVAVIALNNGVGKASCRSVRGIDFGSKIIEAKNQQLIVSGGGHAMAAGFTVEKDKLLQLHQFLSDMFKQDMARSNIHLHEYYNAELTTNAVNLELMEELTKLEPYGAGNNEPIFKFSNLFVLKADIVGGKHARLLLVPSKESYGSKPLSAIAFNVVHSSMQDIFFNKKPLDISVIGSLKLNQWQGKQRIQLQVRDVIL